MALVDEPYADVDDAHRRLDLLLSTFEERADRRSVFLSIYARMTAAVADRIRDGYFEDAEWVSDYLVAFANLYRQAVCDYESGNHEAVAEPWWLAFDAAVRGDALVLQDAALGVNAHINYDLALTLDRVGIEPARARKYRDHERITDIIGDVVDEAQSSLAERDAAGLETLDESLGRVDEWLLVVGIDGCRDSAWRTAAALQSGSSFRRRLARWRNDVTSTGAAHLLLSSQTSARIHETLLSLERSSTDDP